ncbi:MAG: hypothetical protein KF865_01945 [Bdellovibrionaceae bacterium]|nr:hypothetical protein [Pseudobdellovibrionaceae bacterium]
MGPAKFLFFWVFFFFQIQAWAIVSNCTATPPRCETGLSTDPAVRAARNSCELRMKALGCDQAVKDEFACERRDCATDSQGKSGLMGFVAGCWDSLDEIGREVMKAAILDPYEFLKKSHEATTNYLKTCANSLPCKMKLYEEAHGAKPDESKIADLKAMNSVAKLDVLWRNAQARMNSTGEQNRRQMQRLANEKALRAYQDSSTPHPPPFSEESENSSFWITVKSFMSEQMTAAGETAKDVRALDRLYCLNTRFASQLACYAFFAEAAPAIAGGIAAKSPALMRFATSQMRAKTGVGLGAKALPSLSRQSYIEANLSKVATTPAENRAFLAAKEAAEKTGDGKTLFYQVENSAMKHLNDSTGDMNLVTALTNRHKEILGGKIKELERNNPGLEILGYSDPKTSSFALRGKVPADIEKQLDDILKSTNKEFADELRVNQVVRATDKPDTWFRGGLDTDADGANLYTRQAREQGDGNSLVTSSNAAARERAAGNLKEAESARVQLESKFGSSRLMEGEAGRKTLNREVFDLAKKNSDPEKLAAAVRSRYGIDLGRDDAAQLLDYNRKVDRFNPNIFITERKIVNLDEAAQGGFSVDFKGMGSANQQATARGLARATDTRSAITATRAGEQAVTGDFQSKIDKLQKITGNVSECTGDNCAGVVKKALSRSDKQKMMNDIAADPQTRDVRLAFIRDGIKEKGDRTLISTHGELIEKNLQKALEGKIPAGKLKEFTFGVDMQGRKAYDGAVDLIIGSSGKTNFTAKEMETIQDALRQAVRQQNDELRKTGINANYHLPDSLAGGAARGAGTHLLLNPSNNPQSGK